ncbi:MAG: hypothetical protein ACFCVD_17490 [Nodosilinea sp.]
MKFTAFATLSLVLLPIASLPPVLVAPPALAQAFASGPIQAINSAGDTLYLNNDTVVETSLTVSTATTFNGRSIPAGSILRGRFEPVTGGLRYVADAVQVEGQIYSIQAVSDVLHDVKDPREASAGAIAGDAAIGAAGGAAVSGILGNVSLASILGGAAAGAALGNVTAQRVVVVEPNQTITLKAQ